MSKKTKNLFIVTEGGAKQASIAECLEARQGAVICNAETADHAEFIASEATAGRIKPQGKYEFGSFRAGNNVDQLGHLIVLTDN